MTEKELTIYNGLHLFRPEIAHFYKDGLDIKLSNFTSKSNLLGHLLREIDSGLRGVLDVKSRKEELKKQLTDEYYENLFDEIKKEYRDYHYISNVEIKDLKGYSGHITSIISAFDFNLDSPLAKRYIKIAIWFHKYAHRNDSSIDEPRNPKDILKIWSEYEDILLELIGNELPIFDRIDTLLKGCTVDDNIIKRLPFLINTKTREKYFFSKLRNLEWLTHLYIEEYFSGDKNPSYVEVEMMNGDKGLSFPRWEVLDYLLFCTNELKSTDGDFKIILKIIDDISLFRNLDGTRIKNPHTEDVIIRLIMQLPNNLIKDVHFVYIKEAIANPYSFATLSFEAFFARLILESDKKNLLKCLEILFSFLKVDNQVERYYSIIEISFLIHFREKYGDHLAEICDNEGLEILLKKLDEIAKDESFFDLHTIEDHPQNWNKYKYVLQLVFYIRDYLLSSSIGYLTDKIVEYISHEKEIYRRLAFYIINMKYEELHTLLWTLEINPLSNLGNKHELFELIQNHQKEFKTDEYAKILGWIETISYDSFIGEKDYEQLLLGSKKEWLLSLKEVNDDKIKEALEKYSRLYSHDIEHPGFCCWMNTQIGFESPIDAEDIETKKLIEVISLFTEYEQKGLLPLYDFDLQGLSNVIEEDIMKNVNKYTSDYKQISSTSIHFKYVWLAGICKYLESNSSSLIDVKKLLSVIIQIISESTFWKGNEDVPFNYYNWFLNRTLSLILHLLKRNDIVSEDSQITKTLFLILENNNITIEDYSDLSHLSLNHVQGKLYEALCHNLIIADQINSEVRKRIEELLDYKSNNPLLYFSLGKIFIKIWSIDTKWASDNLNNVFEKDENYNWIAAMEGYHIYSGGVNKELFLRLKEGLHYDMFIDNIDLFNNSFSFFTITHIVLAFEAEIGGFNESDNLYKKLIESDNIIIYQNIINSILRNINDPNPEKVQMIWSDLWNFCKNEDSDAKKYFLKESYRLLDHLPKLEDEMKEWILSSTKYMDPYQDRDLFDMLKRFVDINPKIIANIVLDFITNKTVSIGGNLDKIVEKLYVNGLRVQADKICNTLAEKGNNELRQIYEKYHIQ